MEKIKSLQEEYLEQERIAREGLEKLSKEQAEKLELVSKFAVHNLLCTATLNLKYPVILVIPLNYAIESYRIHAFFYKERFFSTQPQCCLNHSFPMHPFSTPRKYQKTLRFSNVFRG